MNNLDKFNQLFEADIKKNKGIPKDYIDQKEEKGKVDYKRPDNMGEYMKLAHSIIGEQIGNESDLEKITKDLLYEEYGSILDGVILDIKIVRPDNSEKREMTSKFVNTPDDAKSQIEIEYYEDGKEIEVEVDVDEVDKRKILNTIMQGESLNIHGLLIKYKDKFNNYSDEFVKNMMEYSELSKKLYWDDNIPKLHELGDSTPPFMPPNAEPFDMANAVEVIFGDEDKNEPPIIKVRALDSLMLLHETVKGIYELIMANALPKKIDKDKETDDDKRLRVMFNNILAETDTLKDEHEDTMFGEFIAADLRDYTNRFLEKHYPNTVNIPNIREFVYGGLAVMEANKFLDFMKKVLTDDIESADFILKKSKIVDDIIKEFDEFNNPTEDDLYINNDNEEILDYSSMSKSDLEKAMNAAIDDGDFETAEEIGKFL